MVSGLGGSKLAMPIEITQFCHLYTLQRLAKLPEVDGSQLRVVALTTHRNHGRHVDIHAQGPLASELLSVASTRFTDRSVDRSQVAGCEAKLRMEGDKPYVTDNHNFIVDLYFQTQIKDSQAASKAILALEGVVDHGLFMDMVDVCIIAGKTGVEVRERPHPKKK
jgi:ribose 5-phosphate isomerase A